MTSKVLTEALQTAEGTQDGDVIHLGKDTNVTMFASIGNQTLTIDRIARVACHPEVVVATTRKEDRFVLAYEDVRALRIGPTGRKTGY